MTEEDGRLHLTLTRPSGLVTLPVTSDGSQRYTYPGSKGTNTITLDGDQLVLIPTGFPPYALYRALPPSSPTQQPTIAVPASTLQGSFTLRGETTHWTRILAAFRIDVRPVNNRDLLTFVTAHPQWGKSRLDPKLHSGRYLQHWTEDITPPPSELDRPVRYVSYAAAVAYCAARGQVIPRSTHYRAAEHFTTDTLHVNYAARIPRLISTSCRRNGQMRGIVQRT